MRDDRERDAELKQFEAQVRAEQARARKIQQIELGQLGSVRGEQKRKAKRKQQKQARRRNR